MPKKLLEKPKRPLRNECYSDRHYLKLFQIYKKERRQWINQNKPKHDLAVKSQIKLKELRKNRINQQNKKRLLNQDKKVQTKLF